MNNLGVLCAVDSAGGGSATGYDGLKHYTDDEDLRLIRSGLDRPHLLAEFERKLQRLHNGSLLEHALEQHCRLFLSLLRSARLGLFPLLEADQERILRLLAYVQKEYDAIPDHQPQGFTDDFQEARAEAERLGSLLDRYKHWRLRHHVPSLWHNNQSHQATF